MVGTAGIVATVALALSQEATKMADHGFFTPGDIKWTDAPNALPARANFTHISYYDFRILRANLLEGGHAATKRAPGSLDSLHMGYSRTLQWQKL